MLEKLKTWMLPVAMVLGGVFSGFFYRLAWVMPALLAAMLFVTYCRLSWRELRFTGMHAWMLVVQLGGGVAAYWWLWPAGEGMAPGVLGCVMAPTAVAAAVVTGMLGGNVPYIAGFTLLSNVAVAVVGPVVFAMAGGGEEVAFWEGTWGVCRQVGPLLLGPLVAAWVLERVAPGWHAAVRRRQSVSFYLWAVSLTTVVGKTVYFAREQAREHYWEEVALGGAALAVCVVQFAVGRWMGRRYGLPVAGAQGLGQKNTVLAVWMAQVYLLPICSVAPAAYVLWQNLINSWQLWMKRRRDALQGGGE